MERRKRQTIIPRRAPRGFSDATFVSQVKVLKFEQAGTPKKKKNYMRLLIRGEKKDGGNYSNDDFLQMGAWQYAGV